MPWPKASLEHLSRLVLAAEGALVLPLHGDCLVQARRRGASLFHFDLTALGATGQPVTTEHPGPLPLQDTVPRGPLTGTLVWKPQSLSQVPALPLAHCVS